MEHGWRPSAWLCGCQEIKWSPPCSSTMLFASEDFTCSRPHSRPKHSQSLSAAGGFLGDLAPGAPPSGGLLLDRAALQGMVAVTGARTGRGHTDISAETGGGDRSKNWYSATALLCTGSSVEAQPRQTLQGLLPSICTPSSSMQCAGQAAAQRLGREGQISSLTDREQARPLALLGLTADHQAPDCTQAAVSQHLQS